MRHIDIHSRKLIAYICLILVFTIGYSSIVLINSKKSKAENNTKAATKKVSTTQTTTVATTIATTTTTIPTTKKRPPAIPITKKFVPKTIKAVVKVEATPIVKLSVPYVSQLPLYPTGCEAASATMLLKYYGYNVSLTQVVDAIPREDLYSENGKVFGPSIYNKFVGDPTQKYTDPRPGYGAFAPVVTKAINKIIRINNGDRLAKNITGCSFYTLIEYIDKGHPVIVWATYKMKTPTLVNAWYIKNPDGTDTYFEYPRGTHVMVLVGYDSNKVYIADPYQSGIQSYSHSSFVEKWSFIGNQSVVMAEKVALTTQPPTTTSQTSGTKATTEKPNSDEDKKDPSVSQSSSQMSSTSSKTSSKP
ncbi:MAG: C39 family peptidase [Oscillospiraceae bacterium]